jgi:hypothetical protein
MFGLAVSEAVRLFGRTVTGGMSWEQLVDCIGGGRWVHTVWPWALPAVGVDYSVDCETRQWALAKT